MFLRVFCGVIAVIWAVTGTARAQLFDGSFGADSPNFAIVGFGAGPKYLGAKETTYAVAPAGQMTFDWDVVTLQANYLNTDLIPDPDWQFGPAGLLRFGRGDVERDAVDALPDIDTTVELGFSGARVWNDDDWQKRSAIGGSFLQDVGGVHDGHVASIYARQWFGIGRYGALGISLAASYASESYMGTYFGVDSAGSAASGLPEFLPGAGARDVRATAVFVQPINDQWAVGAGLLYAKLLGDASDSPISDSDEAIYGGIGIARFW